MTKMKTAELDYLPTREGGPDQLHTHLYSPSETSEMERESCGACAQLANDFTWLRFNDAMAGREGEFGTLEDAKAYAKESILGRNDPRTNEFRDRLVAVA